MPDITIAGATFRNVPQIDIPKDGGGTASFVYEDGSKSITENGTHDVSGFAEAIVNVSGGGGSNNFVRGTFKGTTNGALSLTLPYQGSGYPISVTIYPTGGTSQSAFSELIQQYALRMVSIVKHDALTEPTYEGGPATGVNGSQLLYVYKRNSTSATSYTAVTIGGSMYTQQIASAGSATFLKFNSATSISVYVGSSSYCFAKDIEYTYEVTYSS